MLLEVGTKIHKWTILEVAPDHYIAQCDCGRKKKHPRKWHYAPTQQCSRCNKKRFGKYLKIIQRF